MSSGRRGRRTKGGESADAELMARAEAVPGSFTAERRGDVIVYTEVDAKGRKRRAESRLLAPGEDPNKLPPLVWHDVEPGT